MVARDRCLGLKQYGDSHLIRRNPNYVYQTIGDRRMR
jgi:hypothetical protein